ncbi:MAG: ABC transporter substrate-binding protein [Pseudomonadota bacterium]
MSRRLSIIAPVPIMAPVLITARAAGAVLVLCLALASPAEAADPATAQTTARSLTATAHTALTGSEAPEAERLATLQAAIDETFAFDIWRRFLLGDAVQTMSEAQQAEIEALLPGFLANLYVDQFARGLDVAPEVGDTRDVRRDVLVSVRFPRAGGGTLPTEWRVRDFGERGHLVIDIIVGGISFLQLKRDEFSQILTDGGPEGLIAHMRANALTP